MPSVSAMASRARQSDGADLRALGGDLFHPSVGLLVLLAVTVLNVYKPAGVTPYGWRKQREQRQALQRRNGHRQVTAGTAADIGLAKPVLKQVKSLVSV